MVDGCARVLSSNTVAVLVEDDSPLSLQTVTIRFLTNARGGTPLGVSFSRSRGGLLRFKESYSGFIMGKVFGSERFSP